MWIGTTLIVPTGVVAVMLMPEDVSAFTSMVPSHTPEVLAQTSYRLLTCRLLSDSALVYFAKV